MFQLWKLVLLFMTSTVQHLILQNESSLISTNQL